VIGPSLGNNSRMSTELSDSLCISFSRSEVMFLSSSDCGYRQSLQRSFDRSGQCSHFIINNAHCTTVSDEGSIKDNRVIISPNYSFDSCPAELHFLGKYLLKEYQIPKGQLSGDSSYRNTQLFCLNSVALRTNTITSANQFKPIRITENSGEL